MVNARQGPNNNRNQRGQQIPPPPPNPNMEQFIAAQMQLLQGLTATVQQIQQNQLNQQHQHQQQNAPLARDKHWDFMSHHPPRSLMRLILWMPMTGSRSLEKSWTSPSAMTGRRSCTPWEDSRVPCPTGGMPSQRHTPTRIQ
jgi:hypothetical protein